MASEETQGKQEETVDTSYGRKRYGRMIRMFREGYVSVCIYKNVYEVRTFYDIVIYRKIKSGHDGKFEYKRGANLKPSDLVDVIALLQEAQSYVQSLEAE